MTSNGCRPPRVASLASSAYLASAASTLELQAAFLANCAARPDQFMTDLLSARRDTLPITLCPLPVRQSAWDRPLIEKDKAEIHLAAVGLVDRARLAAISSPHSADWMMALRVAVCGLALTMRQSGWRLASALVWTCVPPISASAAIGL